MPINDGGSLLMAKDILTIPEAARYCAVDRVTMWRWVKSGNMKVSVTPGNHHRILKEDLESFLIDNGMYPLAYKNFPRNSILIVDDDPAVRKVLSKSFFNLKYRTEVAEDGFEAGIKLMQFKPDLIILDLMMPEMDGFEVCRKIKTDPAISHIKILVLTGYGTEENRERVIKAGADDFLVKPVEIDVLVRHIGELLGV